VQSSGKRSRRARTVSLAVMSAESQEDDRQYTAGPDRASSVIGVSFSRLTIRAHPRPVSESVAAVGCSARLASLFFEVVRIQLWNLQWPKRDAHFVLSHQARESFPVDQDYSFN